MILAPNKQFFICKKFKMLLHSCTTRLPEVPCFGVKKQLHVSSTKVNAIKARWCLDVKYGTKMDAVALLQEWVQRIGPGLTPSNAQINSGSVGSPESRLELEVTMDTLAELETFWAAIPPEKHKAWSQRMQNLIIHGSPTWEIFRTVDAFPPSSVAGRKQQPAVAATESSVPTSSSSGIVYASSEELEQYSAAAAAGGGPAKGRPRGRPRPMFPDSEAPKSKERASVAVSGDGGADLAVVEEEKSKGRKENVILDWKGDPMTINPGDRLPFF